MSGSSPTSHRGKRTTFPGNAVGTAPDPPRERSRTSEGDALSAPLFDGRTEMEARPSRGLDDAAVQHPDHPVRPRCHLLVVGDQDQRDPALGAQPREEVQDPAARFLVQ